MDARSSALILVVDDDIRSARVLARMLREDGFDVEIATDGAAAIGRLARAPLPDVLVTDLQLPHADGLAVARYGRSRSHGLPVIVVTGYPHQIAGADLEPSAAVLTKPLDYPALSEELRRALTDQARAAAR